MKRTLLSAAAMIIVSQAMAQGPVITDTVYTGANYVNNKWYSLQNDEVGTAVSSNWDIALAATASPNGALTSSILFNYKVGKVYAIPNATPANSFDTLATVNFGALTELINNDSTWLEGALNRLGNPNPPAYDYGWGAYNTSTHSVMANRIFVVKYADNSVKKFYINLISTQGKYEIVSANLGNGAAHTQNDLVFAPYGSKNYVYYKINTNTVVDREPASASWDFTFLQYNAAYAPGTLYPSFGILNNVGVEAVKVTGVTDVTNFNNYQSQTFSDWTNAIGYNWKDAANQSVPNNVVYFVKVADGNIWKVVFKKFTTGSTVVDPQANNMNVFTKQNLTTLGLNDAQNNLFVEIYPNPAGEIATVVLDTKADTKIQVVSMNGAIASELNVGAGFQTVELNTRDLNNGVYFVNVVNANNATTQRLVVQH